MWKWIHQLSSPRTAYSVAKRLQIWFMAITLAVMLYGVADALLFAPADYQQGNAFRIMYLHVPAAIFSLFVYVFMSVCCFIFLVWKIKLADVVAQCCVSIGALFTAICLITGSIWGRPTWGTWWIWDARLTSELLLLFIYFAIMVLRSSMPSSKFASKAGAVFTLIGLVNIPIIHYSVKWWNTLHQGASLDLTSSHIAPSMLHPLLIMILGFAAYFAWSLCIKVRSELLIRERESAWVKLELLGDS